MAVGRAHIAEFANPVFSRIAVLARLGQVAIPTAGGFDTVNRGATTIRNDASPYRQRFGAGLRIVTDLAAPADVADDRGPRPVGQPAVAAFRRSDAALARVSTICCPAAPPRSRP